MNRLEDCLYPTQKELFNIIRKTYGGKAISRNGGYVLVKGDAPVVLVAHLDTVHKTPVKTICRSEDGDILMSPQGIGGDDRCGVYALMKTYEKSEVKPWLLFTCDEEIGGKGADKFADDYCAKRTPKALRNVKLLIEIDRKGMNDAVYYDCDNRELEQYITDKGFETDYGSYSDISAIAPEMGIAAVNLSSGYYNAHTTHEYIVRSQLEQTINKVVEIVAESCGAEFPKYKYIEAVRNYKWTGKSFPTSAYGKGWYKDYGLSYAKDDDYGGYQYAPEDLPIEYADYYEELLGFYSYVELEEIRKAYGDSAILELYESEFGKDYWKDDYLEDSLAECV